MLLECPNCREHVSFFRAFRTTAFGSFRCKACGSVLGISFARRMLAAGVSVAVLFGLMLGLRLQNLGTGIYIAVMVVTLLVIFYCFERVVLLERRAFTCKKCGYDLQGLPEHRCPECGTAFDPADRERVLARIDSPPPKPRSRWLAVVVIFLWAMGVAVGMLTYYRAARARPATVPTAPQSGVTTPLPDRDGGS